VADDETTAERLDRELKELTDELRVVLPGVQVLFAFLLTVPFTSRWDEVTDVQRDTYFASFLCATASSLCLIAPSVFHRIQWRRRDKERLLQVSNTFALLGATFLALAMTGVVFLITDVLFDEASAAALAGVTAGVTVLVWYGLPTWWRLTEHDRGGQ
jgi:hypothetical protein